MIDSTQPSMLPSSATDAVIVPIVDTGFATDRNGSSDHATGNEDRVGKLLAGLCQSAPAVEQVSAEPVSESSGDVRFENRLAVVRLGMATSLFYSLRTKHAPTAGHCLRVALSCSAWAQRLGLDESARDRIEVAALLHDLGKIGIPDRILRKPGKLSVDEQLTMELTPELGCEILRGCTHDEDLLDIIRYSSSWFESRRHGDGPTGEAIPLGARMLAIADAFDAMTTDTVYRPALSRERAIQELFQGAGTQFDPELTNDFSRMLEQRPEMLQKVVVDRWLRQLHENTEPNNWARSGEAAIGSPSTRPLDGSADQSSPAGRSLAGRSPAGRSLAHGSETVRRETLFYQLLADKLSDGVVFTDAEGTITHWNDAMERLTSIRAEAIVGHSWSNQAFSLRSKDGKEDDSRCVVSETLASGSSGSKAMLLELAGAHPTPVHLQVWPVTGTSPGVHGAVVLARDLSDQANLEEKLESLHLRTTIDPLTRVANRAHFDEALKTLSAKAAKGRSVFSLIICDIDHFKRVNDVHGHPAGDEALIRFASVLSAHSRDGDTVARYGGEEFLLLSPDCDNATAARRAEAIREALEKTPLPSLGGESVTASFGVTEFQSGDTAETVLARADRALLKAKDNGRNRVIQMGAGNKVQSSLETQESSQTGWFGWFTSSGPKAKSEFDIVTPVPVDLAIEKLRGFIADHNAEIISVDENQLSMKLNALYSRGGRRRADQQMAIRVQLTLSERRQRTDPRSPSVATNVHVNLVPIRHRDRRGHEVKACYSQVISSLKSYLMGELDRSAQG